MCHTVPLRNYPVVAELRAFIHESLVSVTDNALFRLYSFISDAKTTKVLPRVYIHIHAYINVCTLHAFMYLYNESILTLSCCTTVSVGLDISIGGPLQIQILILWECVGILLSWCAGQICLSQMIVDWKV